MKYVGYYNGEIGPLEEMKIPMLDRAVYFGDGCYDATTFAHNHIFAVKDHVDRFYNSCRMLDAASGRENRMIFCSMGPLVKSPVRVFCAMKMLCLLKYQMVLTKKRAAQQRATQIVL